MAACSLGVATGSTTDGTSYAAGAFTPALNDLLVGCVVATGTVAAGSMTSTGNTAAWTKITSATRSTGADTLYLFVQTALCTATSTTVTFDCTGDAATGAIIHVVRVSGMTLTGASAVKQSAVLSNQNNAAVSTVIASPTFAASCLTGNPTIEFAGTSEGGMNPATSWTELADTTYATPTTEMETHSRDSGFTGTNIGWNDTLSSPFGVIAAELDTSAGAAAGAPAPVHIPFMR